MTNKKDNISAQPDLSTDHPQLAEYRDQIDKIDHAIVQNIADRLAVVKAVGKYKKANDLEIQDPSREAKLYVKLNDLAKEHGVPLDVVTHIYDYIMQHSREIQE